MTSIYQFKVEGIGGEVIDFADFKGKKLMVVNVASACGYTPQYQQLQELYEAFKDKIAIVGFPANNFGGQEPGSNAEIQQFCTSRFGVSFPLAAKISVVGANAHPIYQWLTSKEQNGRLDSEVKWNFHKYLLDEEGQLFKTLPSAVSPIDASIIDWING
ncbi:MAG: glutathione peroxidase [Bacteroidota bacterium]